MSNLKKVILVFLTLVIITLSFLIYLGKTLVVDVYNEKAITHYKSIFNSVAGKDFVKGEIDSEEGMCVLYLSDGKMEKISFNTEFKRGFINKIYKSKEGNVVLYASAGIFGADREIIYTNNMIIDIGKYSKISRVENNIYVCIKLR